jgi:aspartate carbamoyltransferase catalytic subunit
VLLLDHVTDEGNFGAIVRTAEVVGAAGVVVANARAARVGTAAYKTSAGAVLHLPIAQVPNLAAAIEQDRARFAHACDGRILATLFYEPSTRTRLSFESAMLSLGGQVLGFAGADNSSASKGESVADTIRTVSCFADIAAMRHPKEGAAMVAATYATIPVINAGDGGHQHPTQTLTDLHTIRSLKGRLCDFTIGLCGDLKFGRTVHSLIKALSRYKGIKVVLIAPHELRLPDYIKEDVCDKMGVTYRETESLDEAIPELDVLYMTRVQKERFLDEEEFERVKDSFVLDARRMALAKEKMVVLHPLPRVNEILTEVDDDPRAAYFRQVENGKFVRMALIVSLMDWRKDPAHAMPEPDEPIIDPTLHCTNSKCICNTESHQPQFRLAENGIMRCWYCESKVR